MSARTDNELGAIASHVISHCSTIGENGETVHIAVTTEETHQAIVSGPEESHTIHAIRATTVIFEEDSTFDDNANVSTSAVANIILPNRPHQSALQVEEVGSYHLESHLASVEAADVHRGIVDEHDSDCGSASTAVRNSLYSRNVSIVSAASEDDSAATAAAAAAGLNSVSKNVAVDEYQQTIDLEDGQAHVRFTKTVTEEQQLIGVTENGDSNTVRGPNDEHQNATSKSVAVEEYQETIDLADGQAHVRFTKTVIEEQQVIGVTENNRDSNDGPKPQTIETNELNDTSRQSRIKEIRAQARKASLATRDNIDEVAVGSNVQYSRTNSAASQSNSTNARLFDEAGADEDVEDEALAMLLQRGKAQRLALDEILNASATTLDRQTSSTSVLRESGCTTSGTRHSITRESNI